MQSSFLLLLIGIIKVIYSNRIESSSTPNDASVAVLDCNQKHPNVYFDVLKKEWMVHGADTKCYKKNNELLNLCRMVYPGLSVTNVMKMKTKVKFTVYSCSLNNNFEAKVLSLEKTQGCSKILIKNVTPYKCLYGNYQADNLYIPPTCEFQHLISNDGCQTQIHLNLLATEKCKMSKYTLNSSLLLKWCEGVSTFTGIEFVCCPKNYDFKVDNQEILDEDENIDDDYIEYKDDDNNIDYINYDEYSELYASELDNNNQKLIGQEEHKINNLNIEPEFNKIFPAEIPEVKKLNEIKSSMDKLNANEFISYFNKVKKILDSFDIIAEEKSDSEAVEGTREQKEQYERQKSFIIMSIQNSTESLIKEKQRTSAYLTENTDDKNGIFYEPMLRNLDDQYQIRFERLNKEKDRLLLQEEISYEQQVQGRLNEKKLNALKTLNRVIQEQENWNKVKNFIEENSLKSLVISANDFFIAQENDRLHMVSVYKKLKSYFPEEIYERSQSIINHLESIDKTVNETTVLFTKKFKLLSKCILPLIREHLKRYDQVRIESETIRNELKNQKNNYIVTDLRSNTNKGQGPLIDIGNSKKNEIIEDNNSKNTNFEYHDDSSDGIESDEVYNDENDRFSDEYYDNEDDSDYYSDEMGGDDYQFESTDMPNKIVDDINIRRMKGKASNISTLFLMTAVSLGIFVSLILTYTLIKRKRSRTQNIVKHGFLAVDTSNPEDRHINNMQTNGYENPTYKYFENNQA